MRQNQALVVVSKKRIIQISKRCVLIYSTSVEKAVVGAATGHTENMQSKLTSYKIMPVHPPSHIFTAFLNK